MFRERWDIGEWCWSWTAIWGRACLVPAWMVNTTCAVSIFETLLQTAFFYGYEWNICSGKCVCVCLYFKPLVLFVWWYERLFDGVLLIGILQFAVKFLLIIMPQIRLNTYICETNSLLEGLTTSKKEPSNLSECQKDSRTYGPVNLGLFQGKAMFIMWPPSRIGKIV